MAAATAVEVWSARADGGARVAAELWPLLDSGEKARAQRFRRSEDQQTFVFSHGMLRRLLGERLGVQPGALAFATGPQGKPSVAGSRWQFNLSHSGEWIVCGLAKGSEVGVDVERMRPLGDASAIAARYFSPDEQVQLVGCPLEERETAFFRIWTLKEAFLKATGFGLSFPLADFTVQIEPPRVVRIESPAMTPQEFSASRLELAAGYEAAVVVRAPEIVVRHQLWRW